MMASSHCSLSMIATLILLSDAAQYTLKIPETATLSYPCGYFDTSTPMEYAQITFTISMSSDIYIYGISDECYQCLYLPLSLSPVNDSQNSSLCIILDTQHPYSIGYSAQPPFSGCNDPKFNKTNGHTCAWQPSDWIIPPSSYQYNEYSHYSISIDLDKAALTTTKSSPNKYIPLYVLLLTLFIILITYNIHRIYCQSSNKEDNNYNNSKSDDYAKVYVYKQKPKRFISLDAFRGMSLIIMIFVNYGGGGYWFLSHSNWNGLTVADLVFPWFVFIMGTAMAIVFPRKLKKIAQGQQQQQHSPYNIPLAINSNVSSTITRCSLFQKVMTRGVKLLLIGICIINHANNLKYIRIPGVLQYFAISYVINALLLIFTEPLDDLEERSKPSISNLFIPEVILYWKQWIVALCILIIQLMIIFMLPVTLFGEKCPRGYLGPGGIGDQGKHIECTGGAHRYVDYKLFGEDHVYHSPTSRDLYATVCILL